MTDMKERLRYEAEITGRRTPLDALAEIERLEAENATLQASNERLKSAAIAANEEICQTLGAVLGYPWFKDSPEIFPNASEADGVCVGPDTAETLAQAAAGRIKTLKASNERMEAALREAHLCFEAAVTEGLHDAIAKSADERLLDLLRRRVLWAHGVLGAALSTSQPVETDAERDERRAEVLNDALQPYAQWTPAFVLGLARAIAESDKEKGR